VTSYILLSRVAAAVPIKTRHRFDRTDFEWLAEHVSSRLLGMAAIITGIPQHYRPLLHSLADAIDGKCYEAILNCALRLWGGTTRYVSLAHLYRTFGMALPRSSYR
jgi:hypothetical protein